MFQKNFIVSVGLGKRLKKGLMVLSLILASHVSLANIHQEHKKLLANLKNNPTPSAELKEFRPTEILKDPQKYIHVLEKIIFFWGDPAEHVDAMLLRNLLPPADREKVERMYKEGKFGYTKESEERLRGRYSKSLGIGLRLGVESYNNFRAHNPAPVGFVPRMAHTIKGFPLEALIFYAAIGASMWTKSLSPTFATFNPGVQNGREDPRWVDNWVHEFTSPIGIVSFLAFVMVSQVTQHFYTKWPASHVAMKSLKHRLIEVIHKDGTRTWRYELPRTPSHKTMKFLGLLGGQLGMALGMTASNIVHEAYNFWTMNPSFEQCWNKDMRLLNNQQSALACDMAFEEGIRNAWSWAPMIGSMLTASMISGFLVSQTIVMSRVFMSRATRGSFGRIGSVAFGWIPLGRAWNLLLNMPIARWLSNHRILSRLAHLWAFMETDQRLTSPLFDKYVTEGMKAREVTKGLGSATYNTWGLFDKGWGVRGGMANFVKYHDVDYSTPALSCEETTEEECQYHPSILSMHKTASYFDQWRSYKMQMAQMAHQNWMSHVSNTLSLFDLSRDFYKDLFSAKESPGSQLNQVSYFGNKVQDESTALMAIQKMRDMITDYIEDRPSHVYKDNPLPSEGLISLSPSRFLKKEVHRIVPQEDQKLLILRSLFDVADLSSAQEPSELDGSRYVWDQALKPLYGSEWEKAKEVEEKKITVRKEQALEGELKWFKKYQKYLSIEQYFVTLNELIQNTKAEAKKQREKGDGYETQTFNISITDEYGSITEQKIENCAVVLCGFSSALTGLTEQYVQKKVEDLKAVVLSAEPLEERFTRQQKEELFAQQQHAESALTDYYQRVLLAINAQQMSIISFHNKEQALSADYNLDDLFDNWSSFVQEEKDTLFAQAGEVIKKLEAKRMEIAEEIIESEKQKLAVGTAGEVRKNLRDRALSAGLEYLHHLVHQQTVQQGRGGLFSRSLLTEKQNKYREKVSRLLVLTEKSKTGTSPLTEKEKEELALLTLTVGAKDRERIFYIVELKEKQKNGQKVNSRLIKTQEDQLEKAVMPPEVLKVFHVLGPDNILAKSYEYGAHLKPLSEGMDTIVGINNIGENIEEVYQEDYHPESLKLLKTPGVMDFLLVSALCGPDLETDKKTTARRKQNQDEGEVGHVAQGLLDHRNQLEEGFNEVRTKDVLKDEDKSIMEKAESILNEDIPVFKVTSGRDGTFSPPRITNLNEEDRQTICSNYQTVDNIYDSSFKVGGKEYTSLLQVVKDHIGNKSVSSSSDFDQWWKDNVNTYQNIFKKTADLEHQYVVQDRFIKSFFQNDINTSATLESEVTDGLGQTENQVLDDTTEPCPSHKRQNSQYVSVWDKIACFSTKWFNKSGETIKVERSVPSIGIVPRNRQYSGSAKNSPGLVKEYELNLPRGFFHNVYFEAHFWADVILHFAKKRKQHWLDQAWSWEDTPDNPFMNRNRLESGLQNLIDQFKVDSECLSSEEGLKWAGKIKSCRKWSQDYIAQAVPFANMEDQALIFERGWDSIEKPQKEALCSASSEAPSSLEHFWQTLCHDVAGDGLNMSMIDIVHGSQQQLAGRNEYADLENHLNKLAFFTKNSDRPDGIERSEVAPLPDQIINYALLRLYQLREQSHMQALTVVRYISEHPDFKARQLRYSPISP